MKNLKKTMAATLMLSCLLSTTSSFAQNTKRKKYIKALDTDRSMKSGMMSQSATFIGVIIATGGPENANKLVLNSFTKTGLTSILVGGAIFGSILATEIAAIKEHNNYIENVESLEKLRSEVSQLQTISRATLKTKQVPSDTTFIVNAQQIKFNDIKDDDDQAMRFSNVITTLSELAKYGLKNPEKEIGAAFREIMQVNDVAEESFEPCMQLMFLAAMAERV